jgi:hypothetical protein
MGDSWERGGILDLSFVGNPHSGMLKTTLSHHRTLAPIQTNTHLFFTSMQAK